MINMMKLRQTVLRVYNYCYNRFGSDIYNIGIIQYSDDIINRKKFPLIKWLKHPYKDRWFADPFILEYDDKTITIFVEAYMYCQRKGVIGKIVADRKSFKLLTYKTILELDTHLSFPAILRVDNEIFVYPENCHSGRSYIYKFDREKDCLVEPKELSSFPLTDAAIAFVDGQEIMLATSSARPHGNEILVLQRAEGQNFIPFQTIKLFDNTARGAGQPFLVRGKLIRPSQDCNEGYGRGVVFQEISCENGVYVAKEINRFKACDDKYKDGFHTFNKHKELAVVDGYYISSGLIYSMLNRIQIYLNKKKK